MPLESTLQKLILHYIKKNIFLFLAVFLSIALSAIFYPILYSKLLDVSKHADAYKIVLYMVGNWVGMSICYNLRRRLIDELFIRIKTSMNFDAMQMIFYQSPLNLNDKTLAMFSSLTDSFASVVDRIVDGIVLQISIIITTLAFNLYISGDFFNCITCVIWYSLLLVSSTLLYAGMRKVAKEYVAANLKYSELVYDVFNNASLLWFNDLRNFYNKKFTEINNNIILGRMRCSVYERIYDMVIVVPGVIIQYLLIVPIALSKLAPDLPINSVIMTNMSMGFAIFRLFLDIIKINDKIVIFNEIKQKMIETFAQDNPQIRSLNCEELSTIKAIEFRNVTCVRGNSLIFRNLSFKLSAGESLSIVGPSGIGKTTVLDAITGFVKITEGNIYINEKPIENYSLESLTKQIAYIPQRDEIINGTLMENLLIDENSSITQSHIEQVFDKLKIRYLLTRQEGLNYYVGKGGCNLSGGERKRVVLARILLQQGKSLVLSDEITSGIDFFTIPGIVRHFNEVFLDKMKIVIDHSGCFAPITNYTLFMNNCDEFYFGSHGTLMKSNGVYSSLPFFENISN